MRIKVVKIGGNVIDNPEALGKFVSEFARLEGPKILVHGGGKEATRLSARLEVPTTMVEGRRVTDAPTLDIVTMVYAGLVNKRIVSLLQAEGCNAIGLSGADGGAVRATRRPAAPVDYGFVGDIDPENVNTELLRTLLGAGMTPVFCAVMHDGRGTLLNCNADSVASAVAVGASRIAPSDLVYCFELPGVLEDLSRPDSVIPRITPSTYPALRERGAVGQGMIPKIENALASVRAGVASVTIRGASSLATPDGTKITADD